MEKYLRLYAEPEVATLDGIPARQPWVNVLVIPACNEAPGLLRAPPACGGRSLMVLVINESESAPHYVSLSNQALATAVQDRFEPLWQSGSGFSGFELSLFRDPLAARDVLLVDRFSKGHQLPAKGGVGHARKIGADLAASLIYRKRVFSPWIHCSDGDVCLPDTYFTCGNAVKDTNGKYSALVYPYRHFGDHGGSDTAEIMLATQLYELSLRYYVAGMQYARSPYAFNTIGSTMAVRAHHYAQVRGFPKREAGEDFYLLNKLAKVGTVLELGASPECAPIRIEARRSDRVPFGTGAAVNQITALNNPVEDFRFYHPGVFELLRLWLAALPAIWESGSAELASDIFADLSDGRHQASEQQLLLACLQGLGIQKALEHTFRQSRDPAQFYRQMHTWFDAFRTLKLIHALRNETLSSIHLTSLEANQTFQRLLGQAPDLLECYQRFNSRPGL